ncbi:MAG: MFS transporter, partial [Myxococcales bacterium]
MEEISVARRWLMLALSTLGQSASSAAVNGPVFLIPFWHEHGMSLATAGLLGALPLVGSTCTLFLWGIVVDRSGERFVLLTSLLGSAIALGLAAAYSSTTTVLGVALVLAGAAAAGTGSASGRLVVGWFPPRRRGTAMGIRQMSQPVGVAAAALLVPVLASRYGATE